MQLILFMGIPASGKSTFFARQFSETHVRLNLDMLNTRHRESILFDACLESKTPLVIDNTNPTATVRRRYIEPAKAQRYEIVGYYFRSLVSESLVRNKERAKQVPDAAIGAIAKDFELPEYTEGFDALFYVQMMDGQFDVSPWHPE